MSDEDQALDLSNEVNGDEGNEATPDESMEIDGKRLTRDEISELVKEGMTMKELRAKNIDPVELQKAYTQSRQEIAELKKANKAEPAALVGDDDPEAKLINTFVSHPVFQKKLDESLEAYKQRIEEDFNMKEKLQELEDKYDGSDGKPAFDRVKVLSYGRENNIGDPEVIYKIINEEALDEWKIKNAVSRKPKATYAEKSGGVGSKAPAPRKARNLDEAEAMLLADLDAQDE
jgi:hypothetical protein